MASRWDIIKKGLYLNLETLMVTEERREKITVAM